MVDGSTSAFLALLAACRFDARGLVGLALVVAGLEGCLRGFGAVFAGLALVDRRALEVLDILRVVSCELSSFFRELSVRTKCYVYAFEIDPLSRN